MTLSGSQRIAYGIVGDKGPEKGLGEGSVAMNAQLNGLSGAAAIPTSAHDANARFEGPQSAVLIFPGEANKASFPLTADRVNAAAKARFAKWGGQARLTECMNTIPH